ncbi:MAG TPA: SMI1/KNR4 family protein [Blastocatellia bacterium]|nr:SMI1/KNR4 family protein [Blastocatellia bacterium]
MLEQAGVLFEPGLSQAEIRQIEEEYHFKFPPDLKDFLMFALPVSHGFLNWRQADKEEIVRSLSWPYEGMCFDIAHNSFWLEEWGRPPSLEEAFAIARKAVEYAPALIPINGHRYIPDRPDEACNPVFSVYQTDIIYYGCNLADYLENEFSYYFGRSEHSLKGEIKHIEFWSNLVE